MVIGCVQGGGEAFAWFHAEAGCGDEYALGALHTTAGLGMKPRQRLTAALRAADHHSGAVAAPYTYARTAD